MDLPSVFLFSAACSFYCNNFLELFSDRYLEMLEQGCLRQLSETIC